MRPAFDSRSGRDRRDAGRAGQATEVKSDVSPLRRTLGAVAFATGLVFVAWLPLGIVEAIPFVFAYAGTSPVRLHTAAAVACLLVAAAMYWER